MLEREGDISDVKIIDFGTALRWDSHIQDVGENKKLMISGRKGTPNYMAPEVFRAKSGDENAANKYNELSDMWSIGIITYILCTNKDPFLLYKRYLDRDPKTANQNLNQVIKEFKRQ